MTLDLDMRRALVLLQLIEEELDRPHWCECAKYSDTELEGLETMAVSLRSSIGRAVVS